MNAGLAKALGVMMKLDFERAVLNRVPKIEGNPDQHYRQVLFLCDEYQHFATVGESDPTGDEKFNARHFEIQDLIERGTLDRNLANRLEDYVLGRRNVLISGSTGSGKTSLLNALGKF